MRRVPIDRFQWPLAFAIALPRRSSRSCASAAVRASGARRRSSSSSCASAGLARAASPREAQRLYEAGEYEKALDEYRAAASAGGNDPKLDYNLGAAAYRSGKFGDAAEAFARALRSGDPKLQEQGFYNLGNAQFRLGQKSQQANPQQTMQAWQQALDAFDGRAQGRSRRRGRALQPRLRAARARGAAEAAGPAAEERQGQGQQKQDQKDQHSSSRTSSSRTSRTATSRSRTSSRPKQDEKKDQSEQHEARRARSPTSSSKRSPSRARTSSRSRATRRTQPGAPKDEPQQGEQQAAAPEQAPGQMSPAEARDLLDSLKDGEATLQQLEAQQPQPQGARDGARLVRRGRPTPAAPRPPRAARGSLAAAGAAGGPAARGPTPHRRRGPAWSPRSGRPRSRSARARAWSSPSPARRTRPRRASRRSMGSRVQSLGQTTSVQIVNGAVNAEVTHTFLVEPSRTGAFTIPALATTVEGERLSTTPAHPARRRRQRRAASRHRPEAGTRRRRPAGAGACSA